MRYLSVNLCQTKISYHNTYTVSGSKWGIFSAVDPTLATFGSVLEQLCNHVLYLKASMSPSKLQSISQLEQKGIATTFGGREPGMLHGELAVEKTKYLRRGRVMLVADEVHKVKTFLL